MSKKTTNNLITDSPVGRQLFPQMQRDLNVHLVCKLSDEF